MKLAKMSKNQFFREITCNLSKENTAKLCFKSVTQVTKWDEGKEIPPEYKRLMKFHHVLQDIISDEYVIHYQVSLMALISPVNYKHNSRTWAKRIDFVITDKQTKILAAIELDDSSHNRKKRQERDQYVNESLEGHHKLIRFQSKPQYDPNEIKAILMSEANIQPKD